MADPLFNRLMSSVRTRRVTLDSTLVGIAAASRERVCILFQNRSSIDIYIRPAPQGGFQTAIVLYASSEPIIFNSHLHPGFPEWEWYGNAPAGGADLYIVESFINPYGAGNCY